MNLARRKVFGLIAGLPVVATVAAQKMALVSATSTSAIGNNYGVPSTMPSGIGSSLSYADQLKKTIKTFWSSDKLQERNNYAKSSSKTLDPDLASLRSVSASAAYTMQRARCEKIEHDRTMSYLQRELALALGLT